MRSVNAAALVAAGMVSVLLRQAAARAGQAAAAGPRAGDHPLNDLQPSTPAGQGIVAGPRGCGG